MEAVVNEEQIGSQKSGQWRERIESQRLSGQSIRAWCRAQGIGEHSFYFWRVRLGLSPRTRSRRSRADGGAGQSAVKPSFAKVLVRRSRPTGSGVSAAGSEEVLRLRLAGQRELILPASTPATFVAELIAALEGRR